MLLLGVFEYLLLVDSWLFVVQQNEVRNLRCVGPSCCIAMYIMIYCCVHC